MHKCIDLCDELSTQYLQDIEKFITEWESHETEITVQTSGSTGQPKEIRLDKKRVRASARATGHFFGFKAGESLLLNLSPNYIAGKLMIVRALEHNMRIQVISNQQNPLLNVQDINVNFAAFVPYQVGAILANERTKTLYEKIPNVIIGGAPINMELEKELSLLSNQNYATFGMTETITHFALRNVTKGADYYTCLPGIQVRIDERNCLVIEENQICDQLITNDLVTLLDDSRFIWKGRMDYVINSGGIKISPEELEKKIEPLMEARRFYFHGRESQVFGEEVVLYIEGEKPKNWLQIENQLVKKLERYHRPKTIQFVKMFDQTTSGKMLRKNY